MELKLTLLIILEASDMLLIVPYGIETMKLQHDAQNFSTLLIVPYGIETESTVNTVSCKAGLLIVPYGIETKFCAPADVSAKTFNCTLWN